MIRYTLLVLTVVVCMFAMTETVADETKAEIRADSAAITLAARHYIESQHDVEPERMAKALDKKLAKRTFWESKDGSEYVMEADYELMMRVAETYNKEGDKFPEEPRVEIKILDIDKRVASVKLTADDWIDYMHLYKNDKGDWKVINVLWQYHDLKRHTSRE